MGFLNDLGKVFVRSMVNQVGRDSGKVVSNHVFGDAHSTPIRMVGGSNYVKSVDNVEYDLSYLREEREYFWVKCMYAIGLSVFIPVFGSFIVLWRAVANLMKKTYTMYRKETQGVRTSDLRFKKGYRVDYRIVEVAVKFPMPDDKKKYYRLKGIVYIVIAVLGFIGSFEFWEFFSNYGER